MGARLGVTPVVPLAGECYDSMMIDPFRLCLALGPVAVYLLLLGGINYSRRPFLVSGTRDAAALGLALSGLVVVGPMELFFPDVVAIRFGPYAWVLLLGSYAAGLVLVLLLLRPRLIIYNMTLDQLRPILAELVPQLDPEARWAGDSLAMPTLGVQLHVDGLRTMRNISLVAAGDRQSHAGWRELERTLAAALGRADVGRNPRGLSLITAAVLICWLLGREIARDPEAAFQALFKIFRF